MSNKKKYDKAFMDILGVEESELNGLTYQSIIAWDSVGHMQLVALLEHTFGILFETDDIIDFSSYEAGRDILLKHGIEVNK